MITENFSYYRTLTPELIKKAKVSFEDYQFFYSSEGKRLPISCSALSDKSVIELPGPKCEWRSDTDNLIISRICKIGKPSALFDSEMGLAQTGACIGVAVRLMSPSASIRKVVPYKGEIIDTDSQIELLFEYTFDRKTFFGSISMETVLYLKKRSNLPNLSQFINSNGMIYGSFWGITNLLTDGKTPEFPTYARPLGSKNPLWSLKIEFKDPLSDKFVDSIYVLLNTEHPEYKKIDVMRDDRDLALVCEIYSSALLQIIWKLKYDESTNIWEAIMNSDSTSIKPGSVADFICYILKEKVASDGKDILQLSEKLHKIIYEGL